MRDIKFRSWVENEKYSYMVNSPDFVGEINNIFAQSGIENELGNKITYMQYTGLKDKNGCEIYMGDIAKREFEIWSTQWEGSLENNDLAPYEEFVCAGCFIGVVSQTPQGLYVLNKCSKYDDEGEFIGKRSNVKLYAHRCEIIGNIYENPELLESEPNE